MPDWKEFKIEIKVYLVVKKIHFTFLEFILKLKPPTLASESYRLSVQAPNKEN